MKTLLILSLSLFSLSSFASTTTTTITNTTAAPVVVKTCEVASLEMKQVGKDYTYILNSKTPYKKWIFIKNEDTGLIYPNQEVIKSKGKIYGADILKNKNGYKIYVMDASVDESKALTEHLKTCVKKQDCSYPKLGRCIIAERSLVNNKKP
jgi:hypothetical protein